jgi:hypothetical protein
MGTQIFHNVQIPLLWGKRAIVQDRAGRISVIDLSEATARPEVLGDEPAPGVEYELGDDGFTVLREGQRLYKYSPQEKSISSIGLKLPDCQITPSGTRIGGSHFSGNVISGYAVGIAVTEDGMSMGARLPPGLAKLVV